MTFWTDDLFDEANVSPKDILKAAGDELTARSKILSYTIRENELPDRTVLGFIVNNPSHTWSYNIFEASHRPHQSYPILIDPPKSDIPEFLQRKRYVPGQAGFGDRGFGSRLSQGH